jgi:hypothetical protein
LSTNGGLDLTATCLTGLLGIWADRGAELHLIPDDSKPLKAWSDVAKDRYPILPGPNGPGEHLTVEGRSHRVTFSFASPIEFGSSTSTPGLQIADVLAAVLSDAVQTRDKSESQNLLSRLAEIGALDGSCILPDTSYVDPKNRTVRLNSALLQEFFHRSSRQTKLTKNLTNLVAYLDQNVP